MQQVVQILTAQHQNRQVSFLDNCNFSLVVILFRYRGRGAIKIKRKTNGDRRGGSLLQFVQETIVYTVNVFNKANDISLH